MSIEFGRGICGPIEVGDWRRPGVRVGNPYHQHRPEEGAAAEGTATGVVVLVLLPVMITAAVLGAVLWATLYCVVRGVMLAAQHWRSRRSRRAVAAGR